MNLNPRQGACPLSNKIPEGQGAVGRGGECCCQHNDQCKWALVSVAFLELSCPGIKPSAL